MLTRRIIPCLDVDQGRVVKGIRFAGLRDVGDPAERAAKYEAQGADELVILDVSATVAGRATAVEVVSRCREVLSIPLTVGGGIGSLEDAAALLDRGADRVSINSAAIADPTLITRLADRFGVQCVVVSIDARGAGPGRWTVLSRAGSRAEDLDAQTWAREAADRGAGEILLTGWDRDGTRDGYDLGLIRAVAAAVNIPVIASGGAASVDDLRRAFDAGADAALAASIFHDGETTVQDVKRALSAMGVEVRL